MSLKEDMRIIMKEMLMKYKVNMLFVVIVSIIAGIAGHILFDNKWLGFIFVCLPMCALYIYQTYQTEADYRRKHEKRHGKHQNKYR